MVNQEFQRDGAAADGGPLKHFQIAVGVSGSEDGTPPDELLNPHGLAGLVVNQIDCRFLQQDRGVPFLISYRSFGLMLPTTCSGGMP